MSYPQDSRRGTAGRGFSASGQRTAFGYWVPLAVTVTVATVGLIAWIWSEREDGDDDEGFDYGDNPPFVPGGGLVPGPDYRSLPSDLPTDQHGQPMPDDASVMARMQGALRRTPSPQQIFDGASKKVAAGLAAAGTMMGGALSSIREEDRRDFEDHTRWSEEADSRNISQTRETAADVSGASGALPRRQPPISKRKKTVAIVVSAVTSHDDPESEHASILSHLPEHVDPENTRVFVLIYSPDFKPTRGDSPSRAAPSVASSYSNIGHEDATSPGEAPETEKAADDLGSASPLFKTLYRQAQTLVDKETMIMPFNTPNGHVYMLRHLSPDVVYIQESLSGRDGEAVHQISGWVRQVVVVVGDEGGRGGIIDSEDESALGSKDQKWWQKEGVTGIGKRIDVVEGLRTGEDWRRRVSGYD